MLVLWTVICGEVNNVCWTCVGGLAAEEPGKLFT